ncbi:hypothetical protein MSP8887_03783 [Marinomonas spartinae]|uniref:hypothetical protein n=1 Tax=Marinomonas spartinae TaxID=1792290 RepID=UPI000808F4F2|nr:hypothetical protein [Marinomonas spartinae]MBJ7554378.1 hypothetical protein [Marinomonas spartinae]SBS39362.1 hypothetical protein MSP8887_03783 [Marinomonas spartinae]
MSKVKMISRKARKEPLHDLRTLQQVAAQASRRAMLQAEKAGVSAAYLQNGRIVLRNPDHSTTEVKLVAERPHLSAEDLICQA